MTNEEAMKILHPNTTLTALAEVEYYGGFNGQEAKIKAVEEACLLACKALEKQIPKKPYKDNENGVYEKEHCPSCHRSLFPNDHHCECGQAIDCEVSE